MGDDVVHDGCGGEASHSLTLGTKRVGGKIVFPRCPPPGVIASARSRTAPLIDLFAFLDAMLLAASVRRINQHRATWKSARMQRYERAHAVFLFSRSSEIRQRRRQVSFRTLTMDFQFSITYPGAAFPADRLLANHGSCCFRPSLCLDGVQRLINLSRSVLVGQARMAEIGFKSVSALDRRINQARAVLAQCLEECACITTLLGTSALVTRIERSVAPVWPEVGSIPQVHQSEHTCPDAHLARRAVPFQQVQLLETFKNPEGEIDIDAERIKNLALKLERQSFA